MDDMDYPQTIDFLFNRLPMFSRIGAAAFKNNLDNELALCDFLGNPHRKFRTVHVGGTNGKGSVSHMLASVFQTAGYKTGLYTSPHLRDFRERIKINDKPVRKEFVVDFTERVGNLISEIEPSFFELTVAMAFEYFAQEHVDIAIVEVGLGGRLDSTNIITPDLSVITNISYDHMNMLGDTLEKIAFEKAGIIKPFIPVVVGEHQPAISAVFEKMAEDQSADLSFADQQRFIAEWKFENHKLVAEVTSPHSNDKQYYYLDLTGIYQTRNLLTVLESVHILRAKGWNLPEEKVKKALSRVKKLTGLYGRWELIHQQPMIVLDVGHNEEGIRQITRQIEITDHEELHVVIGLVKDKEIEKILALLPRHANFYFTKAQIPRALPEEQLAEKAHTLGLKGDPYPDVNTALQTALNNCSKKDLIVVCGSVFVVGEVMLQQRIN